MIDDALFSSASTEWATPQDFFDALDAEFHFTLDPCSTHANAKCAKHYTVEEDGLAQPWAGETVWCNPPYGKTIGDWVRKCREEADGGATVALLIPTRTDTAYFHDYVLGRAELRFVRGRLKFGNSKNSAPFPSLLAVFRPIKKGATDEQL